MRPDPAVQFWEGESSVLAEGVTLVRLGGHYPGGTVLHWATGADGRGALLSGDILQVALDTRRVSFMWSYPNMMPLSERVVRRIADTVASWRFERIYGAFPGRNVMADGNAAVERSAKRYIELLNDR
jgi:glyoxylase-like metal-dependent hydrolase (beta-lactamase superfamily II)